jgi:hypothetical protein
LRFEERKALAKGISQYHAKFQLFTENIEDDMMQQIFLETAKSSK